MPIKLYGPNDNYDLETGHVLLAPLRQFREAKAGGQPSATISGAGQPRRAFIHVDDLADAALHLMLHFDEPEIVNASPRGRRASFWTSRSYGPCAGKRIPLREGIAAVYERAFQWFLSA